MSGVIFKLNLSCKLFHVFNPMIFFFKFFSYKLPFTTITMECHFSFPWVGYTGS